MGKKKLLSPTTKTVIIFYLLQLDLFVGNPHVVVAIFLVFYSRLVFVFVIFFAIFALNKANKAACLHIHSDVTEKCICLAALRSEWIDCDHLELGCKSKVLPKGQYKQMA